MPQSLANVLLHIIFSTKERAPLISPEIQDDLHAYLAQACKTCGCPALQVGGTQDHVHIACSLSRTITISKLIEEIKKSSSKWIKARDHNFGHFAWQTGYGVFSVGQSSLPELTRYIAQQQEHHAARTFQEELRAFLKKYRVEYDEQYVWD